MVEGQNKTEDTLHLSPAEQMELVRAQFQNAWQAALKGAPVPKIESFLPEVAENDRPALRALLEKVDASYRPRLTPGDQAATVHMEGDTAETPNLQARIDCTIEFLPGAAAPQKPEPPTQPRPPANSSPHTLLGGPAATIEVPPAPPPLAGSSDQTIDPGASPAAGAALDFALSGPDAVGKSKGASGSGEIAYTLVPGESGSSGASATDFTLTEPEKISAAGNWPLVPGYQILGELGRGGMGVVYKARQVGLRRMVALKMVLAGAHAGAQQLARFAIEAEAVARLQHPNIVQIYDVGELDGLPYFSLEYVDGPPLDKQLGGKPQEPRFAAQMTETLCRAMHFAHQQGIIHRDLKPANVLMTATGVPKISDFGLAKRLEEGDSGQTKTGTIMGTPSYMSPEQARGEVKGLGPLSDQYTIGAILYELLTGRPPFLGNTPMDTVMQVIREEPVAPTRLQPEVPKDLETICLKALQKESHKRYASCFEMAEDLHRFLAAQEIQAKPIGDLEKVWRWCKRNPKVASLLATVALLLVGVAVGSTYAAFTINEKKKEAVAARGLAEEKRLEAEAAKSLAQENEKKAIKNEGIANKQAALSLKTLQSLVDKVQTKLDQSPKTLPLKMDLLRTAIDGLNEMDKEAKTADKPSVAVAAAQMRMAEALKQVGDTGGAMSQYRKVHEYCVGRVKEVPDNDAAHSNLGATFGGLGDLSDLLGQYQEALGYFQESLHVREALLPDAHLPNKKVKPHQLKAYVAGTHGRIGSMLLRLGRPEDARRHYEKAVALYEEIQPDKDETLEDRRDLGMMRAGLAEALFRSGSAPAAHKRSEQALEGLRALLTANPDNALVKRDLARAYGMAGDVALRGRRLDDARKLLDQGAALWRDLIKMDPMSISYQLELAFVCDRQGALAVAAREPTLANKYYAECLEIRRHMQQVDPNNARRQAELMLALTHCGGVVEAARIADQLQHEPAKWELILSLLRTTDQAQAAVLVERLFHGTPRDAALYFDLARCYAQCAAADAGANSLYTNKALAALREAVRLGFNDSVNLATEPDLEPIRKAPGFQSLLTRRVTVQATPAAP